MLVTLRSSMVSPVVMPTLDVTSSQGLRRARAIDRDRAQHRGGRLAGIQFRQRHRVRAGLLKGESGPGQDAAQRFLPAHGSGDAGRGQPAHQVPVRRHLHARLLAEQHQRIRQGLWCNVEGGGLRLRRPRAGFLRPGCRMNAHDRAKGGGNRQTRQPSRPPRPRAAAHECPHHPPYPHLDAKPSRRAAIAIASQSQLSFKMTIRSVAAFKKSRRKNVSCLRSPAPRGTVDRSPHPRHRRSPSRPRPGW